MTEQQQEQVNNQQYAEDVYTKFHWDNQGDKFHIETYQDVAPYLRRAKRQHIDMSVNRNQKVRSSALMGRHMAHVPIAIVEKWMREYQKMRGMTLPPRVNDQDWIKYQRMKLRDPDNRYWRVDGRKD